MDNATNTNNKIEKPISLIIYEAEQEIAQAINNTHLDPSILEYILRNLYEQVSSFNKQQLEKDKEMYENMIAKDSGKNEK